MEFDYVHLGMILKMARIQKKYRQSDIETISKLRLRQPAISAIEHGETRIAVDTLIEYCNAIGIRTDDVLDCFLITPLASETSDAIVDPYVIQLAEMFKECTAAEKGARKANRGLKGFGILEILLVTGLFLFISFKITHLYNIPPITALNPEAEQHDLVLEEHGFLGYTAADFEEAILGDGTKLKKIEVYDMSLSDLTTITKAGFLNLSATSKEQTITYHGSATYTVDLGKITSNSIKYDEENKTLTLYIPHTEEGDILVPRDTIEYGDPIKGFLAFGDLKLSASEINTVEAAAVDKMKQKLKDDHVADDADRFAKMVVWEIYQPVISGIAPDVSLNVEFK